MRKTGIIIIALLTGLIFFSGSTASFAIKSTSGAAKKQSWKKPHAKKKQGWRVKKKTASWRKSGLKKKAPGSTPS
jgi:hypothetical protein